MHLLTNGGESFPARDRAKTPENREIACAFVIYYLLKLSAMGTQRALFEFSHSLTMGRGNKQ
jgi:hypothetical protein